MTASLLLCWYALGLAGTAIYCKNSTTLTLWDLAVFLLMGGFTFFVFTIGFLCFYFQDGVVIWRKP
jgi:hypothetical protein